MINFIGGLYAKIFSCGFFAKMNSLVLHFALRARGYNNFRNNDESGESFFIDKISAVNMEKIAVGIYVMQKNEDVLLPIFIDYYGNLFGYSSIHIFDNGSDDDMKPVLAGAEEKGCNVFYNYNSASDFENKGKIIGEYITKNIEKFNVSIPLDCDEFIVLEQSGKRYISKDLFHKYFSSRPDGAHIVQNRFVNNPYCANTFYQPVKAPKIYFKNCSVDMSSVGFHTANIPNEYDTFQGGALVYYEFHNRPLKDLIQKSKEKMKLRIDLQNIPENYSGNGYHLHKYLFWNHEYEYIEEIYKHQRFTYTGLATFFEKIGQSVPFCNNIINVGETLFSGDDALFKTLIHQTKKYCEYGCGRSTIWVSSRTNAQIVSVDTSQEWAQKIIKAIDKSKSCRTITWIDCGPVGDWGYPKSLEHKDNFISYAEEPWKTDKTYDLVLIDGRFRVLCFLVSLKNAKPGTKILFDDYINRPHYHVIEKVVDRLTTCGRQCLFEVPELSLAQNQIIDNLINKYRFVMH